MKNREIVSAFLGSAFFAVPYLALAVPLAPSLAIGACAFAAGELVFRGADIKTLKETNFDLYQTLETGKKQNKHILDMISMIEDESIKKNLREINDTVTKIIKTIEKSPEKVRLLKNFFDYYLPVTVKIVDRYDEFENQRLSSKEINQLNESTIKTISEINGVFKKFLNNLYESDVIDTNVEIKVLNSMLKSDGLGKSSIKVEEEDKDE